MTPEKFKTNIVDPAMTLLLNRNSLEFFGILTYGMKLHLVEHGHVDAPAYTNGEYIHVVTSYNFTPKSFCTVLIHELWHVINYHAARGKDRDRLIWNLAIDSCTNDILQKYVDRGMLEWPNFGEGTDHVHFKDIHEANPTIMPEEMYDILYKQMNRFTIISISEEGQGSPTPGDGGESEDGEGKGKEKDGGGEENQQDGEENPSRSGGSGGNLIIKVKDNQTGKTHTLSVPKDSPEAQEISKSLNQKANLIWNSNTLSKGDIPGNVVCQLDELFHVEIPWDEIMEKSLMFHSQNPQNLTWATRNYYIPGKILPGRMHGEDVSTAVFVIDSSGSVGDDDLKKFLYVACDSTSYYKNVVVIVHDHKVQQTHVFRERPSKNEVYEEIRKLKGRGGTSHEEAFEVVGQFHEDDQLSVVVFLTDYESDVEHVYKKHRWIQEVPTIWVLNSKHPVTIDVFDRKTIYIK